MRARLSSVLFVLLLFSSTVFADNLTLVTSRAGLGANDYLDWSSVGTPGTTVSTFSATSHLGLGMTVYAGDGTILQQDNDYIGNFAPNDYVLWTNWKPGPVTIDFSHSIWGVGAQIQDICAPGSSAAFQGTISAYNGGTLLGSFNVAGNSTCPDQGDNSAIFIGILDSTGANITSVTFNTSGSVLASSGYQDAVGLNRVSLLTSSTQPSGVPEPATLWLLATGCSALLLRQRNSRR